MSWERLTDTAWINTELNLAIAESECGRWVVLGRDGGLVSDHATLEDAKGWLGEEAPANSMGTSSSTAGAGPIDGYDPKLKVPKKVKSFKVFKRESGKSNGK